MSSDTTSNDSGSTSSDLTSSGYGSGGGWESWFVDSDEDSQSTYKLYPIKNTNANV